MSVGRRTVVVMADVAVPVPGIRSVPLADLDFTVVDVETTGWAPEEAGITEIGAVRVHDGRVVAEYGSLVNPGTPVPPAITELTGISDQMLVSAPPVAAVLPGLLAFAEGSVIAAHNAPFDLRFLTAACAGMGRAWPGFEVLDTVRLARHLMATPQEVPDRKLATLASVLRHAGTAVAPGARRRAGHRGRARASCSPGWPSREGIGTLDELDAWLAARDAEAAARHAGGRRGGRGTAGRPSRLARAAAGWLAWSGCGPRCGRPRSPRSAAVGPGIR